MGERALRLDVNFSSLHRGLPHGVVSGIGEIGADQFAHNELTIVFLGEDVNPPPIPTSAGTATGRPHALSKPRGVRSPAQVGLRILHLS